MATMSNPTSKFYVPSALAPLSPAPRSAPQTPQPQGKLGGATFETDAEVLRFGRESSIWTPGSTITAYAKPGGGYGIATGGAPNVAGVEAIAIFKRGQLTWHSEELTAAQIEQILQEELTEETEPETLDPAHEKRQTSANNLLPFSREDGA